MPAGEVDVLAAVDVPDARALGAGDDERGRRDAAGDVPLAGLLDALGRAAFLQRHGRSDCINAHTARSDTMRPARRLGRVVRQRPAKPFTAVRIR